LHGISMAAQTKQSVLLRSDRDNSLMLITPVVDASDSVCGALAAKRSDSAIAMAPWHEIEANLLALIAGGIRF
ncbi:MAG: hypothetical protein AAF745_06390, partial [Planctomycetota bacterium]